MTTQMRINGLDVAQLQEVVAALKADPAKTQTVWRTSVHWNGGFQNQFQAREHAPVRVDEPQALLGTNTGHNPAELLLGAMGTCLSIGYALNAAARGITIEAMDLEVEGDIDLAVFTGLKAEGNPGYSSVRITARIKSDATPEQLQELHQHALRTSPICSSVQNPVAVSAQAVPIT
jgi:organic hydroperoxide reductase OsmC/OhrA